MQATISFKCNELKLPIHYNYILQGFIYKNISNDRFREFLHNEGFKSGKRSFKLFTFSRLYGDYEINKDEKIIKFKNKFNLTVSSVVDDFTNDFLKNCLFNNNLKINEQKVYVTGVEIEEKKEITGKVLVRTLSPIVIYSTVMLDGKKRTLYHSPHDDYFSKLLRENLLKKADIIGKKVKRENFQIKAIENSIKENIIYYKDTVIKGWSGKFEIDGDPNLIYIALNCGIGSKNPQGFGCIKLIRNL